MTPVTRDEVEALLARGRLRRAESKAGIGRELSFVDGPVREVVVHFGANDPGPHLRDVADRILGLEAEWLLVSRHGDVGPLGLLESGEGVLAIRFDGVERGDLSRYLCTRSVDVGAVSADLYAVSDSGRILVTWDHHTAEEGLSVQLQRIPDATKLLGALNEAGAELELFCAKTEGPGADVQQGVLAAEAHVLLRCARTTGGLGSPALRR